MYHALILSGGYSQIVCELSLLAAATSHGHYVFYHLLSGEDLPIKSQDVIHSFFDAHIGIEFVRYVEHPINCFGRVYGHRLWNKFGRDRNQKILFRFDACWARVESLLHRSEECAYQKGDNWFSIGDSFVRYALSKKKWVEETFHNSFCCDEVFLQTILWSSPFKDNVYRQNGGKNWDAIQRLIDWHRGNPYCFQHDDLSELKESPLMFARKFDCAKGARIIEEVAALVR